MAGCFTAEAMTRSRCNIGPFQDSSMIGPISASGNAARPQFGIEQAAEDPRCVVGQITRRDRSVRMDEFILIQHLYDRVLPGASSDFTCPAARMPLGAPWPSANAWPLGC
ncbi:hypothetical protein FQJ88_04390 [Xanthomonas vasicola]|nr:hypothetical protein FQJ88_04390 [Xanthomonas vasicola]